MSDEVNREECWRKVAMNRLEMIDELRQERDEAVKGLKAIMRHIEIMIGEEHVKLNTTWNIAKNALTPSSEKPLTPILPEAIPGIGWVNPDHPLHPDKPDSKTALEEAREVVIEAAKEAVFGPYGVLKPLIDAVTRLKELEERRCV